MATHPLPPLDWARYNQRVIDHLQQLLQLNTTNPPGNEVIAAHYIAGALRAANLEPTVLESAEGRGNVVARLHGTGEAAPLLLMSHTDVVPVEADKWQHDPFGGEIHDGYIWGRGALDMKHIVAQHLTLMELFSELSQQGYRLNRDLILMAAADEERGGDFGAQWLVDNHPELIRAEYALNEGGGVTQKIGDGLFMMVQSAEKGLARFSLTLEGEPGHGSIPRPNNALLRLAEVVATLGRTALPAHMTPTVAAFLTAIATQLSAQDAERIQRMIGDPTLVDELLPLLDLPEERKYYFAALTHNTVTPTVFNGGSKINVIPSEVTARFDGRTLPGFDRERFQAELAPSLPDDVTLTWEDPDGKPLESELDSPLFDAIQQSIAAHYPDVTLVPTMLTGATDAKAIVQLGTKVYGFSPARHDPDLELANLVHGHNERNRVSNVQFGLNVLADVVWRFAGA